MFHWRRCISAVALCVALGSVHVHAASIGERPAKSDVESTIAEVLPGYWSLHSSALTGPVNYGTDVEPKLVWRFEMVITPKEPLYVQEGTRENLVLLRPTLKQGDHETLYGLAEARFRAGSWRVQVSPENNPFETRGRPKSYHPGRTVVIGSAEEQVELAAAHEEALKVLQSQYERALAIARETHRAALEAAKEEHDADLAALKMRNERALRESTEMHRAALAKLESDLTERAKQLRLEIKRAQLLAELAETAAAKLGVLHAKEAEMLAATDQLLGARHSEFNDLLETLGATSSAQSYRILLVTVSESASDWLFEAALRHGFEAEDEAMKEAAWIYLIQTDLEGASTLRPTLVDHVATLVNNAKLRAVLQDHLAMPGETPRLRSFVRDALPSTSQWASEVVEFSSQYKNSDYAAVQVLGKPTLSSCADNKAAWAPGKKNAGVAFVRVRFPKPVWFPQIGVHESYGVGAVRRIVLWDDDGNDTEFDVQDTVMTCPDVAKFRFDQHRRPVKDVTVVLDTQSVSGWNEIDAISLTGTVLATQ